MTIMTHAFRAAVARLADAGRLAHAAPWIHDLARRLAEVTP